jgi:hypothetical protein
VIGTTDRASFPDNEIGWINVDCDELSVDDGLRQNVQLARSRIPRRGSSSQALLPIPVCELDPTTVSCLRLRIVIGLFEIGSLGLDLDRPTGDLGPHIPQNDAAAVATNAKEVGR